MTGRWVSPVAASGQCISEAFLCPFDRIRTWEVTGRDGAMFWDVGKTPGTLEHPIYSDRTRPVRENRFWKLSA